MPKAAATSPDVLFAALSDRTRLRLLSLLRRGETCVCDLVDTLEVPQPTASRHLAILRRAGLVSARKDGLWSYYSLAEPSGRVHEKVLECLHASASEDEELDADRARLKAVQRKRACCD